MLMRVAERRDGVKVEHGEDLDAGAVGEKLPMLRGAPVVLRLVPRKENDDRMQIGAREPADPMFGGVDAAVAETSTRAAMPCLNSSGKDASGASSNPRARKPFQVKAAVTQRLS